MFVPAAAASTATAVAGPANWLFWNCLDFCKTV
jgi:hypothetical protein